MKKTKMRGLTDKQLLVAFANINNVLNNHAKILNQHSQGLAAIQNYLTQGSTTSAMPVTEHEAPESTVRGSVAWTQFGLTPEEIDAYKQEFKGDPNSHEQVAAFLRSKLFLIQDVDVAGFTPTPEAPAE